VSCSEHPDWAARASTRWASAKPQALSAKVF
jgi:hypothetical protein